MPTCSGTATIEFNKKGEPTSYRFDCPTADGCPDSGIPPNKIYCRKRTVPFFGAGSTSKDHLEIVIVFCACLTEEEYKKVDIAPGGISFPSGCALQLKNVYRATEEGPKFVSADVYCSGSCPQLGEKCPEKPTPKVTQTATGTTKVYTCNCAPTPQ
jgi:hypothetical protein